MSRWYRTGDEERGYNDRAEQGRHGDYPYQESHDYREGWEDRNREERREAERREEERMENEARERQEERDQAELAAMRRAEEEQYYEQQQEPPTPEAESPNAAGERLPAKTT